MSAEELTFDLRCGVCRYNLRGLTPDDDCPECRTPVARSCRDDLLLYADRVWRRRLQWGVRLYLGMIAGGLVLGLGLLLLSTALALSDAFQFAWNTTLHVVFSIVYMVAAWLLTTPEPPPHGRRSWALLARVMLLATGVFGLISAVVGALLFGTGGTVGPVMVSTVMLSISVVGGLYSQIGWFAVICIALSLARRVPDNRLERHTRLVLWATVSVRLAEWINLFVRTVLNELIVSGTPVSPGLNRGVQIVDFVLMALVPIAVLYGLIVMAWHGRRLTESLRISPPARNGPEPTP